MSSDIIQTEYDTLENIASRFAKQAENVGDIRSQVERGVQALQNGGWEGKGSDAFLREMREEIFPALLRLIQALEQAQSVTLQIIDIMKAAEEEAARPFRGESAAATPSSDGKEEGGGFWGGVKDFFGGMYAEGKDMVTGLWNMVTDPIGTAKGLWFGITHPGELWNALKKPYVDDWNSGHPWRAIGRGTMAIVTTVLGTKGADKVAKMLKGATVVDDIARVGSVADDAARVGSVADDVARAGSVADDAARAGSVADDAARVGSVTDDAARAGSVADDAGRLINNTGRALSEAESAMADMLVNEGRVVEVVAEGTTRTADFLVDGVSTELKTVSNLTSKDLSGALSRRILDGAGQAGHIIVDARGQVGLTQELAERAIRRAYGADKLSRLQEIRIVGDGFNITIPRVNP